jgi:hypothetical protein
MQVLRLVAITVVGVAIISAAVFLLRPKPLSAQDIASRAATALATKQYEDVYPLLLGVERRRGGWKQESVTTALTSLFGELPPGLVTGRVIQDPGLSKTALMFSAEVSDEAELPDDIRRMTPSVKLQIIRAPEGWALLLEPLLLTANYLDRSDAPRRQARLARALRAAKKDYLYSHTSESIIETRDIEVAAATGLSSATLPKRLPEALREIR